MGKKEINLHPENCLENRTYVGIFSIAVFYVLQISNEYSWQMCCILILFSCKSLRFYFLLILSQALPGVVLVRYTASLHGIDICQILCSVAGLLWHIRVQLKAQTQQVLTALEFANPTGILTLYNTLKPRHFFKSQESKTAQSLSPECTNVIINHSN